MFRGLTLRLERGFAAVNVDMGDSLGERSAIAATTRLGPAGPMVQVGGTATITSETLLI